MDTQRDHQKAAGLGGVMEYPFDFQSYIQERLRDIRDLDERHFAKEVLLNGMGKAIQAMERKYEDLQERVYQEIEPEHNRYEISMTVIDRRHFDPTNHTLFPRLLPFDPPPFLRQTLPIHCSVFYNKDI